MSMSARRLAMAGLSTIGKWWERYDPVIAYQAFGANSLEESYINLANPGVYDAVPGPVPPSWTRETGWDFPNFTTSYLNTGWTPPDTNVTAIVRYSDMIAPGGKRSVLFGALDGTKYFWIQPSFSGLISWANGGGFAPAGTLLSGVIGFAGSSACAC